MYDYQALRPKLFTEDGVARLREVEARVRHMLEQSGAFISARVGVAGDSWMTATCVDYLVEKGAIRRLETAQGEVVYVRGGGP